MTDWSEILRNLITSILLVFFAAFICMLAWNGWASEFNLPQFGFWHWAATFTAIKFLINKPRNYGGD